MHRKRRGSTGLSLGVLGLYTIVATVLTMLLPLPLAALVACMFSACFVLGWRS